MVTVDPARRLADALGVQSLPNTPVEVKGDWPGHLHALMLDSKGTFDDLVQRYARTPEQAESILANRLYQNLAGALSGTQEYMAMEKLYELVQSKEFDVVVVDTPPTRNALDLLDAPRRLTRFLAMAGLELKWEAQANTCGTLRAPAKLGCLPCGLQL